MATTKTTSKLALALIATLMASGCASAINGTTETWRAESNPSGAQLTTSTGHQCVTPCALEVKRKDSFGVTMEREGYAPYHSQVEPGIDGGGVALSIGNVLFGFVGLLVGAVVDGASGATREPEPNPLVATLQPLPPQPTAALTLAPRPAYLVRPAAGTLY